MRATCGTSDKRDEKKGEDETLHRDPKRTRCCQAGTRSHARETAPAYAARLIFFTYFMAIMKPTPTAATPTSAAP